MYYFYLHVHYVVGMDFEDENVESKRQFKKLNLEE